jgi:hypothetical protein
VTSDFALALEAKRMARRVIAEGARRRVATLPYEAFVQRIEKNTLFLMYNYAHEPIS